MGDVKPLINEQSAPNGWENYPCVPRHPNAKQSTAGSDIVYYIPNNKGTNDTYYPNGTKIDMAQDGVTVPFSCKDPIFQGERKFPKTEEDLSKPGYNLQLNDRGPLVQKLQRLLFNAAEGYANMMKTNKLKKPNFTPFDGIFGPTTKSTVIEFQKDNQLRPDGVVGPKTWNLLKDIRLKYDWDVAKQDTIDTEQSNQMAKIAPKTVTQLPPQA
jgi:hypothetical protein